MSLDVAIEKKLPGFHLAVKFQAGNTTLGLLGPSGSGKSMTLRAIAGLETPDHGRIVLHGRVLFDSATGINLPARQRRIGLLFQNFALFPHLTVAENIAFGLRRLSQVERTRRVEKHIAAAHLGGLADRFPAFLSGGENQRVALARALAIEPAALLLDEPLSALDTHLRSALERQLRETLAAYKGSSIFVSHNVEEAYRVCDKLVVLAEGHVEADGPKEEIFRRPPTMEVARLTGCKNFSRARPVSNGLIKAIDWGDATGEGTTLNVTQKLDALPLHIAIRAHHIRVFPADGIPGQRRDNVFSCWLAAITETPFRVTLDLRIGGPPATPADFHVQAEIFKQQWESFRNAPQPWPVELNPDSLFLLSS
jgi:ABC-type sulfate/molybdate transport systems ATPase subunit